MAVDMDFNGRVNNVREITLRIIFKKELLFV